MLSVPSHTFGARLLALRRSRGWSQEALSAAMGLRGNKRVSEWERRTTPPTPDTLARLARVFEITIDELMQGVRLVNPLDTARGMLDAAPAQRPKKAPLPAAPVRPTSVATGLAHLAPTAPRFSSAVERAVNGGAQMWMSYAQLVADTNHQRAEQRFLEGLQSATAVLYTAYQEAMTLAQTPRRSKKGKDRFRGGTGKREAHGSRL
jgi:transcriptional regulator with XRE-family HTH domain